MARASVSSLMSGLRKLSKNNTDQVSAKASEVDPDSESDEESLLLVEQSLTDDVASDPVADVSDDDDDDELVRDLFGEPDEDGEVEDIVEGTDLSMPDLEPHISTPLNPEAQLLHEESGHFPKSSFCPVCQLSDGPVHVHKSLKKSEIGMLAVDLAGPYFQERSKRKYALVAVWVGVHERK
eukprot:6467349-Amphidinium_carterae.1